MFTELHVDEKRFNFIYFLILGVIKKQNQRNKINTSIIRQWRFFSEWLWMIYRAQYQVKFQGGFNSLKTFGKYKNIWFYPAIPSCWVHRLLTVLYDCHFELNTFSHHLLCRWQRALQMTELKSPELWAARWKYIAISRHLLPTLHLAVISSSKSLTVCSSLWLFSHNTQPLHIF